MKSIRGTFIVLAMCLVAAPFGHVQAQSEVGVVEFPNSGAAEAQQPFLYGLAQLYNFEYDDAAAAFRKAQDIDPNFAMAYWGEAMCQNHPIWMEQDLEAARAILQRLGDAWNERLGKAPTEREKDYLRSLQILFGNGGKKSRDLAYSESMAKLSRKYPDDPDVAAFYALSLLGTAHEGRDFAIYMRAAAVLEEAFRNHPNHSGIVHYLIHSYDDPIHAPLGLRAARIYSRIAPAAAHAQHMTSHIYVALGMWDEVVDANENASGVVNRERAAKGEPPRYCGHYNYWLEYGYLQQGRYELAKRLLKGCYERVKKGEAARRHMAVMDMLDPDNSSLGSFIQMRLRYLLETGNWKGEIANWEIPLRENVSARLTNDFTRGFGAVQRSEVVEARSALQRLKDTRRQLESYLKEQNSTDPSYAQRAEILEEQLQAMTLFSEGKGGEAVDLLRKAAKTEKSMAFAFGPPFVDNPTQELLGEILMKMNHPLEARAAFERALARTPTRTASLLGLARAANQSGDKQKAEETYSLLRRIWKQAEQSLKDSLPQE